MLVQPDGRVVPVLDLDALRLKLGDHLCDRLGGHVLAARLEPLDRNFGEPRLPRQPRPRHPEHGPRGLNLSYRHHWGLTVFVS